MAGMLPGVESARRRRFHGSGGWWSDSPSSGSSASSSGFLTSTRRSSSFGLMTPSSTTQRIGRVDDKQDERLGGAAREARERLDERLRAKWKSQVPTTTTRVNNSGGEGLRRGGGGEEGRREVVGVGLMRDDVQTEVFGVNKSGGGSKRMNWAKKMRMIGWKASEQEECAVCLDRFKDGETLSQLPCAHRFHTCCLHPWLLHNAYCPCCRLSLSK